MKSTFDLPDELMRQLKMMAASRSLPIRALLIEAIQRMISEASHSVEKPEWKKHFGAFQDSPEDTIEIQRVIDQDLSSVNPEEWS